MTPKSVSTSPDRPSAASAASSMPGVSIPATDDANTDPTNPTTCLRPVLSTGDSTALGTATSSSHLALLVMPRVVLSVFLPTMVLPRGRVDVTLAVSLTTTVLLPRGRDGATLPWTHRLHGSPTASPMPDIVL
mmetsp:Transcript_8857/g.10258  ORF Transcript_8857/g.10258 Transcript_8857/m.10258 type:complete len:133 (-) Transcript_8857:411-809(-)|eukprot:CAMPEP_0197860146 /NCGR_PEP_ID=MMETSP1438-20131217/35314_1 /TAXON_ID=1461541 /ORGANISM="Pterosperma sp., Strain CCMP1384" /LENGTH=132 /DNA_ID=CAMNT_0043476911 /DNA_START=590 /DNA_END=988 /DNA_ORIENTATION=+